MDATLLRGSNGKVIFMECSSQLIDTLLAITKQPFGAVIGALTVNEAEEEGLAQPGATMYTSVVGLQEGLFVTPRAGILPQPMDLEAFASGTSTARWSVLRAAQVNHKIVDDELQLTSTGGAWNTNVALDVEGRSCFELSIRNPDSACNFMLGIAPSSVNVNTNCLYTTCGFYVQVQGLQAACGLYGQDGTSNKAFGLQRSGSVIKMRLMEGGSSPLLQYAFDDNPFVTAVFNTAIGPDTTYCPVIVFAAANVTFNIESQTISPTKKVMNSTVKFLVTNRMRVYENSSTTAIQLIAHLNGESLKGLRTEAVKVTAAVWRRLIAGSLLARDDILDVAFPSSAEGSEAATEDTGSENSFQQVSLQGLA